MLFTGSFDSELTSEHIEELCCALMQVALLGRARRHALFDDAEVAGTMEMPAVAQCRWSRSARCSARRCRCWQLSCGGLLPSEQRDDRVYTKRKCVPHRSLFFPGAAAALQTWPISLSLFGVRWRCFQRPLSMAGEFL